MIRCREAPFAVQLAGQTISVMTQPAATRADLAADGRQATSGGPAAATAGLTAEGPRTVLPSAFDVTGLATASVAAAALAAAEYHAARNCAPLTPVRVNSRAACTAFAAEALFTPDGWTLPAARRPTCSRRRPGGR